MDIYARALRKFIGNMAQIHMIAARYTEQGKWVELEAVTNSLATIIHNHSAKPEPRHPVP